MVWERRLHTLQGVFGIARTTRVEDGDQLLSWLMVVPARMEMSNLLSSALCMPSSVRIA